MYGKAAIRARGDYGRAARRYRGDPGIFGTLGKIVGGGLGIVGGLLPGPAGAIVSKIGGAISGTPKQAAPIPARVSQMGAFQDPRAMVTTQVGPGGSIYKRTVTTSSAGVDTYGIPGVRKRYRRMNVTNPKALRRATRRIAGFGKLVQRTKRDVARAARATGAVKSSSGRRRPLSISERGSGSVVVS